MTRSTSRFALLLGVLVALPPLLGLGYEAALLDSGLKAATPGVPDGRQVMNLAMHGCGLTILWFSWRRWGLVRPLLVAAVIGVNLRYIWDLAPHHGDFDCYLRAAEALLQGTSLWEETGYLYPPLLAQGLALPLRGLTWLLAGDSAGAWAWMRSVFCYFQLVLLAVVWVLADSCLRRVGIPALKRAALATFLLAANQPLISTLQHLQVNLLTVAVALGAMLAARRHPLLAGLLAAVGTHVKLYPAVLLLAWLVGRRWRAAASFVSFALVLSVAIVGPSSTPAVWSAYFDWLPRLFTQNDGLRSGSIYSFLFQVNLLAKDVLGLEALHWPTLLLLARVAAAGLTMGTIVVYLRRASGPGRRAGSTADQHVAELVLASALLAIALLASPVAWHHQFVGALPIALCTAPALRSSRRWCFFLAVGFVFCMPDVFALFPLSHLTTVGVLMLLGLSMMPTTRVPGRWPEASLVLE